MINPAKHVLSARQFERADFELLISTAKTLLPVALGQRSCDVLRGAILANLFFEPSTRSRISFGSAFSRLGGSVLDTADERITSLVKGESIEDTARVISGYADVIAIRHKNPQTVVNFAAAANVPVINAGAGDGEHPTQALTDLLTMDLELAARGKSLDGSTIAVLGDLRYGRTAHSFVDAVAAFKDITFVLISPSDLKMPSGYLQRAREGGHTIIEVDSLDQGIPGADVIYATRYQQERFECEFPPEVRRQALELRLTRQRFEELARKDAVIMHPLPRDSQFGELATDLDTLPNLAIFAQTRNGVPIRMALFAHILNVQDKLDACIVPAKWNSVRF